MEFRVLTTSGAGLQDIFIGLIIVIVIVIAVVIAEFFFAAAAQAEC